jgi:hypothetical protein
MSVDINTEPVSARGNTADGEANPGLAIDVLPLAGFSASRIQRQVTVTNLTATCDRCRG